MSGLESRITVGGMNIASSKDEYKLDHAIMSYIVFKTDEGKALIDLISNKATSDPTRLLTKLSAKMQEVIQEDVLSYLDFVDGGEECQKYKNLKAVVKGLLE